MKTLFTFLLLTLSFIQPVLAQNTLDGAGLTAATPSSIAFSLRKLSISYSGPIFKVRRAIDNAEANVAFDGSNTVSASSMVTFTSGVVVGALLGNLQTGTISSEISKAGTITIKPNKTGTISIVAGSLTVTGTGTSFTTELIAGDRLFNAVNNSLIGIVASISGNTSLSLNSYAISSATSINYKTSTATVTGTGTNFTGELLTGDRIFNTGNSYLGTVSSIASATSLTLNAVDAVAATASLYKGSSETITGTGTNFTTLVPGDLMISNNTTLGIVASIVNATSLMLTGKAGASVSGLAWKSTTGSIPFSSFYASTAVYVNTWYDQSGNSRDAIQLKPVNQPRIVNGGILYAIGGRASMEYSSSLASFLQTSTAASWLNNTVYTLNKVTAEATNNPSNQFPLTTTGGNGPINTVLHFGYRSSAILTLAQLSHDQNFNASAGILLESHTAIKLSAAASQFYKNGVSLGTASNGVASYLLGAGLISIGLFTPTSVSYNGFISEIIAFPSALSSANVKLLDNNQSAYYSIVAISWTGAVSTDWNNTGNWSTGVVPTLSNLAIVNIPAGKPFYPVIDAVTVQANSISIEAGASLIVNGTGILQLAGTINNLGTCNLTAGTIEYIGTAQQGIAANTFNGSVLNLIVNNNSTVLLNGNITVSGNLTFTKGKLAIYVATLTIGGIITNTVTGGLKGEPNSSLVINGSVSPTLSFDQTTSGLTNILKNLTINSSGQMATLANNLIMLGTGTTTFTAGKLAIGSSTLTIQGAVVNSVNEGLRGGNTSNLMIDGTLSKTLSFDQTTPGTTNALANLSLNCTGQTVTLNKPVVVTSVLTLTAGTLSDGGNQLSSTGTLNLVAGTFKLGSPTVATTWPAFTTHNISAGGTVEYAAGISQTVSSTPSYQNLTISANGGAVAANDLNVNGILTLSSANPSSILGSLSMSIYTLNMGASATTAGQGDVTGIVKRISILPNINYTMGNEFTSVTFPNTGTLPSQMSMKTSIGIAPSWQAGAINRNYDFIQTGGSGTKAVIRAHYLDSELNGNIENKLVDFSYRFSGATLTEHGKSNFNTTQNWVALSNVNVAFFSTAFGNVNLSLDASALTGLIWNGSTSTSWITATNWTPNGGPSTNTILTIPDAATTPNDPSLPASASNGSLTIESGGILNADPGAQLTLNNTGLAWSNNGTFNASTSTVSFTDPDATINGITNFNNVTIETGAGLLLTTGTIFRIGGAIINNGSFRTGLLSNTVEYNGNNQTIISPNASSQSYNNLIISGTGTSILPPVLNLLGDLTINGPITVTGNTIGMNGTKAQTINGISALMLNNLWINNSASGVSFNQPLTVAGTLTFTAGKLAIGNNTLTLSGNVINNVPNGITGSSSSNLIINGVESPVLSFDQTTPGTSNVLNNLTINSGGQVPSLGSDLELKGTLAFTAGKLSINGHTLTLNGSVTNTVNGGLRGSSTSNLLIQGGMISPTLSFDQTSVGSTNLLNNFSMNSTGNTTTLVNPLVISGTLNLLDGIINTTTANRLTLTSTSALNGGSDLSFVNGPLTRNTSGTSAYIFPVGKAIGYEPISITPATNSAGVYEAEFFPFAGPAGSYAPGLTAIAIDEYWNINRISGPDAQVTLNYRADNIWSSGSPTTADNIFVTQFNGGAWEPKNGTILPGNTGIGMNPITSKALTSLSAFTFGYSSSIVLPVRLISFKAARMNDYIQLSWTVAGETAFSGYEIERSPEGSIFNKIASLSAINNINMHAYNWLDHAPLPAVNFYRLRMLDIDGVFRYSSIVKVNMERNKSMSIYPNPITDHTINLEMIGQPKGNYLISLYNIHGGKLMNSSMLYNGSNGVQQIVLNESLQSGTYYLKIQDPEKNSQSFKIVIKL